MSKYIPRDIRSRVFKRDGKQCRYCGSVIGPFQVDHVYPESKGGLTSYENLVVACYNCNMQKGSGIGMWPKPLGYFDLVSSKKNLQEDFQITVEKYQNEITPMAMETMSLGMLLIQLIGFSIFCFINLDIAFWIGISCLIPIAVFWWSQGNIHP